MCQFKIGDLYNGFKLFEKRWEITAADKKKFINSKKKKDSFFMLDCSFYWKFDDHERNSFSSPICGEKNRLGQ
jgi:hypothetical protein